MANNSEKPRTVGIRLERVRQADISSNKFIGIDESIVALKVEKLNAIGNDFHAKDNSAPSSEMMKSLSEAIKSQIMEGRSELALIDLKKAGESSGFKTWLIEHGADAVSASASSISAAAAVAALLLH